MNKARKGDYPRTKSWGGARAAPKIIDIAKEQAKKLGISLADYLENLVLADSSRSLSE